ncbi:hypothetical protein [Alsobacter sp. R-9]
MRPQEPRQPDPRPAGPPAVGTPREAEALAERLIVLMAALEDVVGRETALLRQSRLKEATDLAQAKSEAARDYVHGLEALKINAIAMARWAPAAVERLRKAQARLSDALTVNMTVLATARSVSEGIVRSLASELAAPRTLTTYGAGRPASSTKPAATSLLISRSL